MTVLVVDDSSDFRLRVRGIIDGLMWEAPCIEEGLLLAQLRQPSVIVLDNLYRGSRRTGIGSIEAFREVSPRSQVIIVTACFVHAEGVEAVHRGAFSYVPKGDGDAVILGLMVGARRAVSSSFVSPDVFWLH